MRYYEQAPTIFEQLTIKKQRANAAIIWSLIMLIVNIIGLISVICYNETVYLKSGIFLLLIGVIIPHSTKWTRDYLFNLNTTMQSFVDWNESKINDWLSKTIRNTFSKIVLTSISGIITSILGTFSLIKLDIPFQSLSLKLISIFVLVPLFFFCGATFYNFLLILIFPQRLSKLPIKVPLYQDAIVGITALKPFIYKFSLICLGLFVLLYSAILTSPYSLNPTMYIWLSFFGVCCTLTFPLSVLGLHKSMKQAKKELLRKLAPQLEAILKKCLNEPSDVNLNHLMNMFSFRDELNKLPEWPIDFKTILSLASTAVIPIIALIIDVFT
ncbi:hypothetical protein E9993_14840 [Labilibacter sediminis]|nr:hypothetical protein E9993_14840 [Labilibacter sediminis]